MRDGDLKLHALLDRREPPVEEQLAEPSSRCFGDVRMNIICWEIRDLLYYLLPSPTRRKTVRTVHSFEPSNGRPYDLVDYIGANHAGRIANFMRSAKRRSWNQDDKI